MTTTRIAVLGAGANGASIGADLARAGEDVVLIEQWPEHVEAMRRHGARIEMPEVTLTQPVRVQHLCEVATLREPFDVVLLVNKAYDTRWSCHLIAPLLKPDGLLAGVQNGMTVDAIAEVVGPQRTIGCVIEISSMMFDPGVVQRHSGHARSWFAVGGVHPSTRGREEEIARLLRHSGSVEIVDDIRSTKWMKLVSNATTLVTTAILGLPMKQAVLLPGMRDLMIRSGREALDTGRALGHRILPIFGLTAAELGRTDRLVEQLLDTLLAGFVLPDTKTTVLQDWMKGRHSEVDDLNGLVAREGRRHGVATPVNDAVVEIARRIERGELEPDADNIALLKKLSGRGA
ncbi:MAG: 2-dehydropantoate 2-reductase [Burkholderiales bacterium]|nr:2-dehydropantoate 2-reductase [Burkholderiales bacterium]